MKFTIAVLGMALGSTMMLGSLASAQDQTATPTKVAPRSTRTKTPRPMKHAASKKTAAGSHEPAVR